MKHYLFALLTAICLIGNIKTMYAQTNDEFVGDWVGTYNNVRYDPNSDEMISTIDKMWIRINKIDTAYTVRIKSQTPGADMDYWPECKNVSQQGNSLHFTMDRGYNFGWDGTDKKNGQRINSSKCVIHASVLINKNTLNYKFYLILTYFGDSGKIGEERMPIKGYFGEGDMLYKDDGW